MRTSELIVVDTVSISSCSTSKLPQLGPWEPDTVIEFLGMSTNEFNDTELLPTTIGHAR